MASVPQFCVISGEQVHDAIAGREKDVLQVVESAYRLHGEGGAVNPGSHFLRFPGRPSSRSIALPAAAGGEVDTFGIKWIASFPENVDAGLPRASAVMILNDAANGYPFACLEASIISAVRTAASAALAASRLTEARPGTRAPRRVGFIGAGLIARYIMTYLGAAGFDFDEVGIHDLADTHAQGLAGHVRRTYDGDVTVYGKAEDLIRSSDLIVFATVAGRPHVTESAWFDHHPLVLHVSLRDLSPEVILASYNVVDDVDHCLTAETSPHLAELAVGNRDFVAGSMYDLLAGALRPPSDRAVIFSPFGLGLLDLAVGRHVYDRLAAQDALVRIPGFFHELRRHG
ncbi:2,3-diaminopropionate biosynthesis protein SbnB [Streptomyces sp. NPDC059918]|uniref:2,3-diaminopropionate biosynthesis protein SbnB n=1 Tax=unclassified Streptomyces TaxID=2593676 RepID=UPI003652E4CA